MAEFASQNGLYVVGQPLDVVEKFEDKDVCQAAIEAIGVPVPVQALVNVEIGPAKGQIQKAVSQNGLTFPVIVKPVRGRGSAGVKVVDSVEAAAEHIESHVGPKFGSKFLIEEYLAGRELAVTVMPPGSYETADGVRNEATHWTLPAIERTGHHGGVMPFSGVVPIQSNSKPAGDDDQLREFGKHAVRVAQFLNATAPIRIDCREGANGVIKAIDINMKPSMTGPGRPGREQMINLSAMSAGEIGWSYTEMERSVDLLPAEIGSRQYLAIACVATQFRRQICRGERFHDVAQCPRGQRGTNRRRIGCCTQHHAVATYLADKVDSPTRRADKRRQGEVDGFSLWPRPVLSPSSSP